MIRTYTVIFSARARKDIWALSGLIEQDRGAAVAFSYVERLQVYCLSLQTFPQRGHFLDRTDKNIRVIGFERRVTIHFRINGDEVVIPRLLYAGRQP